MVKNICIVYGKKNLDGTNRDRSTPPIKGVPFKKQSIFFQYLPYWPDLEVPHAIDAMHVQKNVFESLIATLMDTGWKPPLRLRRFESCGASFSTMPRWINPSLLHLSHLVIYVDKVQSEDIQNLGELPALRSIILNVTGCIEKATVEGFMVSTDAFPYLRECCFNNFVTMPSMFPRGAMLKLQFLRFSLRACDVASSNLDFGMGHLPSLERVHVDLWCQEASTTEVKEIEAALSHAAETHPNSPAIDIHSGVREPAL